jgi:hypothetical protein
MIHGTHCLASASPALELDAPVEVERSGPLVIPLKITRSAALSIRGRTDRAV